MRVTVPKLRCDHQEYVAAVDATTNAEEIAHLPRETLFEPRLFAAPSL
jgi:hypothetical protein